MNYKTKAFYISCPDKKKKKASSVISFLILAYTVPHLNNSASPVRCGSQQNVPSMLDDSFICLMQLKARLHVDYFLGFSPSVFFFLLNILGHLANPTHWPALRYHESAIN